MLTEKYQHASDQDDICNNILHCILQSRLSC